MNTVLPLLCLVQVLSMAGCSSTDPLTLYINKHGFEQLFPPTSKATIGDVYESVELTGQPLELVENVLSDADRDELMACSSRDITLMSTSKGSRFKLDASVFALGYLHSELASEGISYFRVSAGDATEYLISRGYFDRLLLPKILDKNDLLCGAYVYSLLEVQSLEYEFYTSSGTKVDIEAGDRIADLFKDRAGAQWTVNERHNIEITSPRFIGFKAETFSSMEAFASPEPVPAWSTVGGYADVDLLIAQVTGISTDAHVASLIISEVKLFRTPIGGSDFIRLLGAANITTDAHMANVISSCAPYLRYPLSPDETRAILRSITDDSHQANASRALNRAGRQ